MPPLNRRRRAALPKSVQLAIYCRDGWLCRWCAKPVIFAPAMKLLELELKSAGDDSPLAYYHLHWTRANAPLLDELGAVLDHVAAFAKGGRCEESNLVTACAKCNGRKSAAPLAEWNQRDIRQPIHGKYGEPRAWDGMSGVFTALAERHLSQLTRGDAQWLAALKATSPSALLSTRFVHSVRDR